jgi:hypothetical protein
MKRLIRVLASCDLVLYIFIGLSNTLLVTPVYGLGGGKKLCGSLGTCLHTFFLPFSSDTATPNALLNATPAADFPADNSDLLTLIVFLIIVLLAVAIVTLSTVLHRRDESRRWSIVLTILTVLLVLSPITLVAGLGVGFETMALLALVVSLIALASTFSAGRGVGGN